MTLRDPDPDDPLGADPNDYTNASDDAHGVMICLRCLTAAVLRVAKAIEAHGRADRKPEGT